MKFLILLLVGSACFLNFASAEENFAKVLLRQKRSPSHLEVDLETEGTTKKLKLRHPGHSIFAPDFKFTIAETGENGEIVFRDVTPSRAELVEMERRHFIDRESSAAVSLTTQPNGELHMNGVIENMGIKHDGMQHRVFLHKDQDKEFKDYVEVEHNNAWMREEHGFKFRQAGSTSAEPEVYVFLDYANYKTFGGDTQKMLDYMGVFFHAINNRYATFNNPSITFSISGVTASSSRSAQPYMESNVTPDGTGYDINQVLTSFSKWAYANQGNFPKFDMATVISGSDFQSKNSNGQYSSSVSGLAYLGTACLIDKQQYRAWDTSVGEDIGGFFDGAFTMAHEFAHNLGAPHDGDGKASNCPWSDGYIMSYMGWGTTNKFYFSDCSQSLMGSYIQTSQAACLQYQNNTNGGVPVATTNIGDWYSMGDLCKLYTKQSGATVDWSKGAAALCKSLVCKYPTPNKPGWVTTVNLMHPPGDYVSCDNNGGQCVNGDCVQPNYDV